MEARSTKPERLIHPSAVPKSAAEVPSAEEFSRQITVAENINLRERVGRLEASIAFWAADVDEASEENARLRSEIDGLKRQVREAGERANESEADGAALLEAVSARESHIALLESRVVEKDLEDIDSRRTRARLHALRMRVRSRLTSQSEEIEGLRRTLSLGHAARRQVEDELRDAHSDAARNARYLDKIEQRLKAAEAQLGRAATPGS